MKNKCFFLKKDLIAMVMLVELPMLKVHLIQPVSCISSIKSNDSQHWLHIKKKRMRRVFMRRVPSQTYGASPATWDHTVLPATRHKWTRPALTPARQAGTRFTYPGGMEGWVDLGYPAMHRPGVELAITRPTPMIYNIIPSLQPRLWA